MSTKQKVLPTPELLRAWSSDPANTLAWGLDAVADELIQRRALQTRVRSLLEAIVQGDPNEMAADAVTVLDVWRKEAADLIRLHVEHGAEGVK